MSASEEVNDIVAYDPPSKEERPGLVSRFFAWVAWTLWGKRRWLRECDEIYRRLQTVTFTSGKLSYSNPELEGPLNYKDMNLEHYERLAESAMKPVLPPPDCDDEGLN